MRGIGRIPLASGALGTVSGLSIPGTVQGDERAEVERLLEPKPAPEFPVGSVVRLKGHPLGPQMVVVGATLVAGGTPGREVCWMDMQNHLDTARLPVEALILVYA